MTTVVVLGSNSFTGSHIVDQLLDDPGFEVVGISRSPEYQKIFLPYKNRPHERFRFRQLDFVRNFPGLVDAFEELRPGLVINVAALSEVALSYERPDEYFETNSLAVARLVRYFERAAFKIRYVHVSSAEIFGPTALPVSETHSLNPSTPYAASKAAADLLLQTMITHRDFPGLIIRSTNVFGRYQQLHKIIPRAVIYLKLGKTIELHGGGAAKKSFVHVRDVVRGMMRAIATERRGVYHFSRSDDRTVGDVVRHVCEAMGLDFDSSTRVVGERPGQDARYWLDTTKAHSELGWNAEVDFEDGVRDVIEWIQENWDEIRRLPLEYRHKS